MNNNFLTADEVAELLKISKRTLERMKQKHGFPAAYKLTTKCYRYKLSEIEKWLQGRKESTQLIETPIPTITKQSKSKKKLTELNINELNDFLDNYQNREGLLSRCQQPDINNK